MAEERVQIMLAAILAADVVGEPVLSARLVYTVLTVKRTRRVMQDDRRSGSPKLVQAAVRRAAISVCFTPSTGLSGSGVTRHTILATDAPNVRFLPVPSGLPQRADVRAPTANGCF